MRGRARRAKVRAVNILRCSREGGEGGEYRRDVCRKPATNGFLREGRGCGGLWAALLRLGLRHGGADADAARVTTT